MTWSNKTGLPVAAIERLWRMTQGADAETTFQSDIETDTVFLSRRKHVLVVSELGSETKQAIIRFY